MGSVGTSPSTRARSSPRGPRILRLRSRTGIRTRRSAYGDVAELFSDRRIEMVRVTKDREPIDPDWFVSEAVDLLVVVQGRLRVEFASSHPAVVLGVGDVLILPARARCRAYRWPRRTRLATVFLAVYPAASVRSSRSRAHTGPVRGS